MKRISEIIREKKDIFKSEVFTDKVLSKIDFMEKNNYPMNEITAAVWVIDGEHGRAYIEFVLSCARRVEILKEMTAFFAEDEAMHDTWTTYYVPDEADDTQLLDIAADEEGYTECLRYFVKNCRRVHGCNIHEENCALVNGKEKGPDCKKHAQKDNGTV